MPREVPARGYLGAVTGPRAKALPAYLATATLARSASESAGPALLVVTIAVLGSAATGSYVVAAMTASAAIGGPVIGALLDRTSTPRRGFAWVLSMLAVGLSAIAITIGHVPTAVILVFAVIAGFGYPAATGAWSAQLPRLVPSDGLTRAYSADAATYSVAAVVAPPLAAALVAVAAQAPLWLSVALVLASLVGLRGVPLTPAGDARSSDSLLGDLRAGTRVMMTNLALRRTVIITTIGFAGQAAVFVTAPVLAQDLTGSLQFTGVILGVFAAGGVLTALWFTRRPVERPDRMVIASTLLSAAALAAIGAAPTPWLLLVAAFAMGAVEPPLMSAMFQIRARESPSHVQSQVFTTSASLRTAAFAASTAACGALITVGVPAVILFGVALHLLAVALGLVFGPRLPHRGDWVRRGRDTLDE